MPCSLVFLITQTLISLFCLQRRESRGGHYCSDYPVEIEAQRCPSVVGFFSDRTQPRRHSLAPAADSAPVPAGAEGGKGIITTAVGTAAANSLIRSVPVAASNVLAGGGKLSGASSKSGTEGGLEGLQKDPGVLGNKTIARKAKGGAGVGHKRTVGVVVRSMPQEGK